MPCDIRAFHFPLQDSDRGIGESSGMLGAGRSEERLCQPYRKML
jgi:hypothetical protein